MYRHLQRIYHTFVCVFWHRCNQRQSGPSQHPVVPAAVCCYRSCQVLLPPGVSLSRWSFDPSKGAGSVRCLRVDKHTINLTLWSHQAWFHTGNHTKQSVPRLRVQIHELNTNPMLGKGSLGNCSLSGSFWTQRLQSMKPPKSCVKATFLPRSCQSGRLLNYDPDAKCLQVRQWNISISHLRRKQLKYPWMSELCFCSFLNVCSFLGNVFMLGKLHSSTR